MSSKISVIIPIYNAEKYLNRCLDSIINQTHQNLEIILVDDGSKDNGSRICDEYAKNDNRIVVIHKNNQGVSSARNDGLSVASGDYIAFIDSDDWIHKQYFEILLYFAEKHNSDAVTIEHKYVKEYIDDRTININDISHKEYNAEDIVKDIHNFIYNPKYQNVITCGLYGMYSRKAFENMKFDTSIHIGEDIEMIYRLIYKVKNVTHLDIPVYYYYISPQSAMRSEWNIKKASFIKCLYNMYIDLKEKGNKEYVKFEYEYIANFFGFLINEVGNNKDFIDGYKVYEKDFRNNFKQLIRNSYLTFPERFMMILYYFNIDIYKKFYGKFQSEMSRKIKSFSK